MHRVNTTPQRVVCNIWHPPLPNQGFNDMRPNELARYLAPSQFSLAVRQINSAIRERRRRNDCTYLLCMHVLHIFLHPREAVFIAPWLKSALRPPSTESTTNCPMAFGLAVAAKKCVPRLVARVETSILCSCLLAEMLHSSLIAMHQRTRRWSAQSLVQRTVYRRRGGILGEQLVAGLPGSLQCKACSAC